jgi:2,3-dihydroxybiphenyl 1,2-dioxygenase
MHLMTTITALGYVVVRGPVPTWKRFGTEILGMQLVDRPGDSTAWFRTDGRAFRLVIEDGSPGPDALVALGFEVGCDADLDRLLAELDAACIAVKEDPDSAAERRVRRLVTFLDVDGNRIEAFVGQESVRAPFVSPRGVRFVCGDLGLGHVFMFSANGYRSAEFYQSVLGFKLSDTIAFGPENGIFLHCGPRHHSMAFAAIPGPPPGIGHLMIEVDSLEAVGRALDIVEQTPGRLQMTIGEHTNDRMTSFYVNSPSGFAIEYGCNGLLVDDAVWKVGHYDAPSLWGHHFVAHSV